MQSAAHLLVVPNAPGKRRRSTEGAQGTNKGHENAEGMAYVGVRVEPPVRLGRVGTVLSRHLYL